MSDEIITKAKALANTTEAAFAKAEGDISSGTIILEKRELVSPGRKSVIIEAFDELSARKQLESQFKQTATITSLKFSNFW